MKTKKYTQKNTAATAEVNFQSAERLLATARAAWESMADMRATRRRALRYTYGDQWFESTVNKDGKIMTEGELMTVNGHKPITNNLIRRMVKAVVGRYRDLAHTNAKASVWRAMNHIDELDARTLEEFLISGMAIHHVWAEARPNGSGVWVDNVNPDRFFIAGGNDARGCDTRLIGRLIDMPIGELMLRFSEGSVERARRLRAIYEANAGIWTSTIYGTRSPAEPSFSRAQGAGLCRVIEVWQLSHIEYLQVHDPVDATIKTIATTEAAAIEAENSHRKDLGLPTLDAKLKAEHRWRCTMLAPDGTMLQRFNSPLPGGCHPFCLKLYPMVDGKVHSLVDDVIDQQRYVNRLVTMMDRMMGAAAKGVLLFPEHCKVDEMDWDMVGATWSEPGGVLPYHPYQGLQPQQAQGSVGDIGARDMLATQIKMFEDVSGVSRSMLGNAAGGGVGVDRYNAEVNNSVIAINDLLMSYADFISTRDAAAEALAESLR